MNPFSKLWVPIDFPFKHPMPSTERNFNMSYFVLLPLVLKTTRELWKKPFAKYGLEQKLVDRLFSLLVEECESTYIHHVFKLLSHLILTNANDHIKTLAMLVLMVLLLQNHPQQMTLKLVPAQLNCLTRKRLA